MYHTDESDASPVSDNTGGSARTDYQRNQLLSSKAKKRRMILKQKAAQAGMDLISVQGKVTVTYMYLISVQDRSL